jgi:hypothetical protein
MSIEFYLFPFFCKESQPSYLPALRGLGESLLAMAQQYLETYVDKNAVDCVQQAANSNIYYRYKKKCTASYLYKKTNTA